MREIRDAITRNCQILQFHHVRLPVMDRIIEAIDANANVSHQYTSKKSVSLHKKFWC